MSIDQSQTPARITENRENTIDPSNWVDCEDCGGSGVVFDDGEPSYQCDGCGGTGGYEWECDACGNTAHVHGYDCAVCELVADFPEGWDHKAITQAIVGIVGGGK